METWPDFEKFLRSSFRFREWVSGCDRWFLGVWCKWKKFLINATDLLPLFTFSLPSGLMVALARCLAFWLPWSRIGRRRRRKNPEHPNGLTKCKRHVITNQDKKRQTTNQRAFHRAAPRYRLTTPNRLPNVESKMIRNQSNRWRNDANFQGEKLNENNSKIE